MSIKRVIAIALFSAVAFLPIFVAVAREHVVARGESFEIIAKRYGVSVDDIQDLNPHVKACYAGMKLQIPEELITTTTTNLGEQIAIKEAKEREAQKAANPSFWQKVGQVASIVGEVTVTTASALSESGLIDNMGDVGVYIGGTADIVNATKGVQSNYMAEASHGEYASSVNTMSYQADSYSSSGNLDELRAVRASKQAELDQINAQISSSLRSGAQNGSFKARKENYNVVKNSPLEARRKVLSKEIYDLNTQIAQMEGTYDELLAKRAENKAKTRQARQEIKARNKKMKQDYRESRRASQAADFVGDIEADPIRLMDAQTRDLYEREKKIVEDHKEKLKNRSK